LIGARRIGYSSGVNSEKVYIIGGGVVGLCSAYYAMQRGFEVVVLDIEAEHTLSASFGNAGMVVPSHFIPLAAPGMIKKGLKWMFNPESPFAIRPRLDLAMARWGYLFWKYANEKHVEQSMEMLAEMNLVSSKLFQSLSETGEFGLKKRGLMMLCQTQEGLDSEAKVAEMAKKVGVKAEVCDAKRVAELDPGVDMNVKGGIWWADDCHMDPTLFMLSMRGRVTSGGGKIRYKTGVKNFIFQGNKVVGLELTNGERVRGSRIVVASGAWSHTLAKKLGLNLPLEPGKGYSMDLEKPAQLPELCSLFAEAKVAVTPMGNKLRVAGTMEIGAKDLSVNPRRIDGIKNSISNYFPKFSKEDFEGIEPWAGFRPCSPDGIPYIGLVPRHSNVILAGGHGMMGLSLGPITGQMVADLLVGEQVPEALAVGRF